MPVEVSGQHDVQPKAPISFEDEKLICVDEQDHVTGHASKATCHDGAGMLHRALSVFLFNSQGEVLLQQRSVQKRLWPMWWANSCCSHPREGEQVDAAAKRRLFQELGVDTSLQYTHKFIYHAPYADLGSEYELCSVYIARSDAPVLAHPDEIAAVRWLSADALDAALADKNAPFTPWLRLEWQALRAHHWPAVLELLG